MSFVEPTVDRWDAIKPGQRIEIALIQLEITFPVAFRGAYSDEEMATAHELVRNYFYSIAEFRQGKLLFWEGTSGAFMFHVRGQASYDNCCLAAIEMLEVIPSLNQQIQASEEVNCPIEVRISCDAGPFIFDVDYGQNPEAFARQFMQSEPAVSLAYRVTITERIYRQMSDQFKARFERWKHSPELGVDLYAASASQETPMPRSAEPPVKETPTKTDAARPARMSGLGLWRNVVAAIVIAALLGIVIYQNHELSKKPAEISPAPVAELLPGDELVNSPEWKAWRKKTHVALAPEKLTDDVRIGEALTEVLPRRPSIGSSSTPAAMLRRDEAIADVLLSYEPVATMLWDHFGIDKDFLGTGLSKPLPPTPGNIPDYGTASIHEYLVPNLQDSDQRVWWRKIEIASPEWDLPISDLVTTETKPDPKNADLQKSIVIMMKNKDGRVGGRAVIRFAILDEKKYKNTLGRLRPEAWRVFASDLPEVWDLTLREAARRSGYELNKQGDSLFVWIFLPTYPASEAVPATWTNIMDKLPEWMSMGRRY